jgi:putative heme-binding domain-containing protein
MIRGEGGYLGPDLSNLGVTQNLARIREGLLNPNKRFTSGFDPVVVTLSDGTSVRGVAKNYSNYAAQVLDSDGKLHLLDRANVKLEFREMSWMPADYSERLSEAEIDNLIAFLSRQSVRPVKPSKGGASQ